MHLMCACQFGGWETCGARDAPKHTAPRAPTRHHTHNTRTTPPPHHAQPKGRAHGRRQHDGGRRARARGGHERAGRARRRGRRRGAEPRAHARDVQKGAVRLRAVRFFVSRVVSGAATHAPPSLLPPPPPRAPPRPHTHAPPLKHPPTHRLGDREVEVAPGFRLLLHTKLSNPHYPPEVQAEATLINFTVTEQVRCGVVGCACVGGETSVGVRARWWSAPHAHSTRKTNANNKRQPTNKPHHTHPHTPTHTHPPTHHPHTQRHRPNRASRTSCSRSSSTASAPSSRRQRRRCSSKAPSSRCASPSSRPRCSASSRRQRAT